MSIQEHLNKIRNAIKGSEVRESIAKGIETAYDDASENGNANMEVKLARGTEPNLNSRLNKMDNTDEEVKSQLAEKAQQIIDLNETKMNKSTTNIAVSQINKNLGKFDQTFFTEETIQQWTGGTPVNSTPAREGITRDKLADNSVPFNVLSFVKKSNNLFNKNKVTAGFSISSTTGELVASPSFNVSEFVYVKANQLYSLANVGRWALYDENFNFISSNTTSSFTTPSNTFYARFAVSTNSLVIGQVNLGSLVAYDEFKAEIEEGLNGLLVKPSVNTVKREAMTQDSVDPFSLLSFKKPNNILNKKDIVLDKSFSHSDGTEITDTDRVASKDHIRVKPNQIYSRVFSSLIVALYDKDKKWGQTLTLTTSVLSFTTPSWCHFIRVSITKASLETFMLNEGSSVLPYEDYKFTLQSTDEFPLALDSNVEGTGGVNENDVLNAVNNRLKPFRSYNYQKINYPDVVASLSSTGCDVEQLGFSFDGTNRLYGIKYGDVTTKPVIYIVAAQHGSEWMAVNYTLDFMRRISGVSRFYDTELMNKLRYTFAFYAIVCANPTGYINNTYNNANNVNLNRNWDQNWESFDGGGVQTQNKGVSPFSEPETQIIRDKFLELQPYMCIDGHTSGSDIPGGIDTGKFYTEYNNLLFGTYKELFNIFNDGMLEVQEWNVGASPTLNGWAGKQTSKEGTKTIATTLEQNTSYTGNYALTALFALTMDAYNKFTSQ